MISIENTLSVKELKEILNDANDNDFVCIRQCVGTDFPPFISIEHEYERQAMERGGFECLTME